MNVSWVDLVVAQTEEPTAPTSILSLISQASGMVLFVLLILVAASVVSWFIIGYKYVGIRRAEAQSRLFQDVFWMSKKFDEIFAQAERLSQSPVSQVFQAGYVELRKLRAQESESTMSTQLGGTENVERALRRAMSTETAKLEQLTPFLATVGSTAPFVGLFGTVWGIMIAFMNLHGAEAGQTSIDVVAGPIAEALIATAIGLMAAIPAVVAYNFLNARIHTLSVDMENFSNDFLNIVKRHFFK
ncbi:MAG: protein TolQ [Myxococcales bacterium]|nr:protein TolQ [Myxococcales bacterium]MCB9521650.1 protein TolQ [Myxococcales bacterium]MCB9531592.1 protein TolQ [Myxococcales bacterium]MCB9532756.1 protein TolQ [Myxococcales bacterium]